VRRGEASAGRRRPRRGDVTLRSKAGPREVDAAPDRHERRCVPRPELDEGRGVQAGAQPARRRVHAAMRVRRSAAQPGARNVTNWSGRTSALWRSARIASSASSLRWGTRSTVSVVSVMVERCGVGPWFKAQQTTRHHNKSSGLGPRNDPCNTKTATLLWRRVTAGRRATQGAHWRARSDQEPQGKRRTPPRGAPLRCSRRAGALPTQSRV